MVFLTVVDQNSKIAKYSRPSGRDFCLIQGFLNLLLGVPRPEAKDRWVRAGVLVLVARRPSGPRLQLRTWATTVDRADVRGVGSGALGTNHKLT